MIILDGFNLTIIKNIMEMKEVLLVLLKKVIKKIIFIKL